MATITASDQQSGTSVSETLQTLTTPGVTPTGSDRAVWVTAAGAINGATANYWDEARYTNSGGGLINDYVGADQELSYFGFTEAYAKIRGEIAPASGSSLPIYVHWPSGTVNAAVSVAFIDGADQTTPFATEVTAGTGLSLASGTSAQAITLPFTGLDPDQRVIGSLVIFCFGTNAIGSVAEGSGATSIVEDVAPAAEEARQVRIVTATGVADGSGNITLDIDVTASSNDGFIWYTFNGNPINDAAGGDSVIAAATGAATASALAGSSNASTTASAAAGVATASAATGSATANSTRASASGVATTSAAAGSSTASAAESAAAGGATAGAMAGSSTSVAAFVAATGAATASTLSSDVGASIIAQADGVATASAMAGASTAVASFVAANGQASAANFSGPTPSADAVGGWGTYYPRRKRRLEPEELPQGLEAIQEDADKRQKAIQARQALRRAEMKDQQVTAQLRQIYAEQDALKRGVLKAKAQKAAEQDDEDAITILFALAS